MRLSASPSARASSALEKEKREVYGGPLGGVSEGWSAGRRPFLQSPDFDSDNVTTAVSVRWSIAIVAGAARVVTSEIELLYSRQLWRRLAKSADTDIQRHEHEANSLRLSRSALCPVGPHLPQSQCRRRCRLRKAGSDYDSKWQCGYTQKSCFPRQIRFSTDDNRGRFLA
jgi:hypothetical protein